jgi:hypothetical protein
MTAYAAMLLGCTRKAASTMAVSLSPRPTPQPRAWPSPQALREQAPIFRLLAAIEEVPSVTRIGASIGSVSVTLWVFMEREDDAGEARIYEAERAYLTATSHGSFALRIIPGDVATEADLPPHEILFER